MNPMKDELKAYIDGELTTSEARTVEAALREDPLLSEELEQIRELGDSIRRLESIEVIGYEKTLKAIQSRRANWKGRLGLGFAWAGGLCALALTLVTMMPNQGTNARLQATNASFESLERAKAPEAASASAPLIEFSHSKDKAVVTEKSARYRQKVVSAKPALSDAKPVIFYVSDLSQTCERIESFVLKSGGQYIFRDSGKGSPVKLVIQLPESKLSSMRAELKELNIELKDQLTSPITLWLSSQ